MHKQEKKKAGTTGHLLRHKWLGTDIVLTHGKDVPPCGVLEIPRQASSHGVEALSHVVLRDTEYGVLE